MTEPSHDLAVYGGYMDDDERVMRSASGGIATALAEHMIEAGGYVAGVAYSADFHQAEYIVTNDRRDLEKLQGSKYIETDKQDVYRKVKSLLERGEKALFIGLPCVVAALYGFLGERPERLWTCELVCHGPTSAKVHEEYVSYLEGKYHSAITEFSVRHKKREWTPPYLYAKFANGKTFEKPFYSTEYGFAFSVFGRESCYHCPFKGDGRRGDIMIGDFWGATDKDAFWNRKGVSVMFAETEKGREALQALQGVRLFPTTFEKAVAHNPMVVKSKERQPQREKFARLFAEKGLRFAAKHCVSPRCRLKALVVRCVPRPMVRLAKRAYRLIRRR